MNKNTLFGLGALALASCNSVNGCGDDKEAPTEAPVTMTSAELNQQLEAATAKGADQQKLVSDQEGQAALLREMRARIKAQQEAIDALKAKGGKDTEEEEQEPEIDEAAAAEAQKQLCETSNTGHTTGTFGPIAVKKGETSTLIALCLNGGKGELLAKGSSCKQDPRCTEVKGPNGKVYEDWRFKENDGPNSHITGRTILVQDTDEEGTPGRDTSKDLKKNTVNPTTGEGLLGVCWQGADQEVTCESSKGSSLAIAINEEGKKTSAGSGTPAPQTNVSRGPKSSTNRLRLDNIEATVTRIDEKLGNHIKKTQSKAPHNPDRGMAENRLKQRSRGRRR